MLDAALLPDVLAAAPDALVVVDAAGCVRYANRQLTVLFGYEASELLGRQVEMLLPERLIDHHVGHRLGFQRSMRVRPMGVGQELFALRKDGSEFPVDISLSPIGVGDAAFVVAAIRDATDRREAESQLRQARIEAERANLAKSRFLSTASHDLRQPLQALALLNGTLRRTVHEPAAMDAVEHQGQAIAVMSRLLISLLDIGKLEYGTTPVEITDFDLDALLSQLRGDFQVLAAAKGLRLELDCAGARVRSDRTLVMQVLRNLLANAIKFTDHGTVCVRCRPGQGSILVDVTDTGIGISPGNVHCIFDEFFQAGTRPPAAGEGYGLGLNIVRRIVQLLKLGMTVKSEPGAGSTFTLELPASMAVADRVQDDGPLRRTLPRPQRTRSCAILLVEDDPSVRRATKIFLQSEGHLVTAAVSLAEALECSARMPVIDLVISDYHLAGMTGTAVVAALRERAGRPLASILMTGDSTSAIRDLPQDKWLRIISKPVDAEELLDLVHNMTASAQR